MASTKAREDIKADLKTLKEDLKTGAREETQRLREKAAEAEAKLRAKGEEVREQARGYYDEARHARSRVLRRRRRTPGRGATLCGRAGPGASAAVDRRGAGRRRHSGHASGWSSPLMFKGLVKKLVATAVVAASAFLAVIFLGLSIFYGLSLKLTPLGAAAVTFGTVRLGRPDRDPGLPAQRRGRRGRG